jgi:hypothetical protein
VIPSVNTFSASLILWLGFLKGSREVLWPAIIFILKLIALASQGESSGGQERNSPPLYSILTCLKKQESILSPE